MVIDPASLPAAYRIDDPQTRQPRINHLPRCVFIEVTNHCNLQCATCPHTVRPPEPPAMLTLTQFGAILDQFPEVERVVLHGIGEPLLNRHLPAMIQAAKTKGATVLFNTNATLLTDDWSALLLESDLDELRCSIGSTDRCDYLRIHGADLLVTVIENLKQMVRMQQAYGSSKPRISFWITAMKENIQEIPRLVQLASDIGISEVYVQRLVYFLDNDGQETGLMKQEYAVYQTEAAREGEILEEAMRLAEQLGVSLWASGATNPRESLAGSTRRKRPWSACVRPWTTAYITANGNALPCCISPFATIDYGELIMGNVFDRSFADIWNDGPYRHWRTALLSDTPALACSGCGVAWSL